MTPPTGTQHTVGSALGFTVAEYSDLERLEAEVLEPEPAPTVTVAAPAKPPQPVITHPDGAILTGAELHAFTLMKARTRAREAFDQIAKGTRRWEPPINLDDIDTTPADWLVQGLIPLGQYGAMAAEKKAGKTWMAADLAVSVATGTPFLERFDVTTPGPVLLYHGEGDPKLLHRRVEAIRRWKRPEQPANPVFIVPRVPNLTDPASLRTLADDLEQTRPVLVIIDPLYLAMGGQSASDLNAMGNVLAGLHPITQAAGTSLLIVHHWNKTGQGGGVNRMSGVGLQEWSRFMLSMGVRKRDAVPNVPGSSRVELDVETQGGDMADDGFTLTRCVWSDDPDDLGAPLHYSVETAEPVAPGSRAPSAIERVTAVLQSDPDRWWYPHEVQTQDADNRPPGADYGMKTNTVQGKLTELARDGIAERERGAGRSGFVYRITTHRKMDG